MVTVEPIYRDRAQELFERHFSGKDLTKRLGQEARWIGSAADQMGLPEHVQRGTFLNLLGGCSANGLPWAPDWTSPTRVAGWHFEVKAPKSLSVLWGIGKEEVRMDLEGAHRSGVESMLRKIETLAGIGHPGGSPKCLFAVVRFGASERGDPELQANCVLFNLSSDETGGLQPLGNGNLFKSAVHAERTYWMQMAGDLDRRLGWSKWEKVDGERQLSGIPEKLQREFSAPREPEKGFRSFETFKPWHPSDTVYGRDHFESWSTRAELHRWKPKHTQRLVRSMNNRAIGRFFGEKLSELRDKLAPTQTTEAAKSPSKGQTKDHGHSH